MASGHAGVSQSSIFVEVQDWFRQNFLDICPILHCPAPILEQSHGEEHPDERAPADDGFRKATLSDILTVIVRITKHLLCFRNFVSTNLTLSPLYGGDLMPLSQTNQTQRG